MIKAVAQGEVTFDDFCFLVKDGQKADLIDGVIYMASPDNIDANRLSKWLVCVLEEFTSERDLGEIYILRVAFRLDKKNGPEPDIGFLSKKRLHLVRKGYILGAPDWALEIVSPESIERDYEKKRLQYEEHGVREYWIVDPIEEKVTVLRLNKLGKYEEVEPIDGIYHSKVVDGFWLDPAWLWQTPRPRKSVILARLLGEDD